MSDLPPRNIDNAYGVYYHEGAWYFYDWRGEPSGPYTSLDAAWEALDDYCNDLDEEYD